MPVSQTRCNKILLLQGILGHQKVTTSTNKIKNAEILTRYNYCEEDY
jgi:hypothetical protein